MELPWTGDACSLVDAFRAKEVSPLEALDATLAAIERSGLNAFSYVDPDAAREAAGAADVDLPFGGVPMGVKELTPVAGWPDTEASLVFKDRRAEHDSVVVARLRQAGAVLAGLTTSSEFGGVSCTCTKLNGATCNPWSAECTPGGSSGGTASAVAGGLVPIGTAGDGGGSIRIPAAFCGLPGLKCTYGRFPKGPHAEVGNVTAVPGCISRSVRDIARWLDVCGGFDPHDPFSLPRVEGWEDGLGSHDLAGMTVAIVPDLGCATIHPEVESLVRETADVLVRATGLKVVDLPIHMPALDVAWALTGLVGVLADLGDRYPACEEELTREIRFGLKMATQLYNVETAARAEASRREHNDRMADLFSQVDFVMAATNPDTAFAAEGPLPTRVGEIDVPIGNNGALTIPSNIYGNPAVTIPAGVAATTGLPVGLQVLAAHHREALLLDLALVAERERPWPLVAPGAPC